LRFLLDTNAVSEPTKPQPNASYSQWLDSVREIDLFVSVITLGELRRGVALLPQGPKRERYEMLHSELAVWFGDRVLSVDEEVAATWGDLSAQHRRLGRHPSVGDELLAATALVHDLVVVTRNVTDFEHSGCKFHSPWG
jgi:predicted nucleic acid-binding protein